MTFSQKFKPRVPKRFLLFEAAALWSFAGGMLLFKGFSTISNLRNGSVIQILISLMTGIAFYLFVFTKISIKHVQRILKLKTEYPCLFSFINWKSYLLMILMISSGILLKKSEIIPLDFIGNFYLIMGIPLLFSAVHFYYGGFFYKTTINLKE